MKGDPVRFVDIVQVIRVEVRRGAGTKQDSNRVVTQYWSTDGRLLAEEDPATIPATQAGVASSGHLVSSADFKRPISERLAPDALGGKFNDAIATNLASVQLGDIKAEPIQG